MDLLGGVEASALAAYLRASRWTYPLVNAAHLVGVALLVGAIAPLDLRLMGFWPREPVERLAAVLRPVAAAGAALAAVTGLLLFTVHAREYAGTGLFRAKMALIALGLANALVFAGPTVTGGSPARRRLAGAASLALWVAVLVCGRMLGYL